MALEKPDAYAYAPSEPVLYHLLDAKMIKEGKFWYIPENVQRVTRSKTPGPIPCHDLSRVDMHHPPVIPMSGSNPTVEVRCTAEHNGNEPL